MPTEYLLILYEKIRAPFIKVPKKYTRGNKDLVIVPGHRSTWNFYKYLADSFNKAGYKIHVDWGFDGYKDCEENAKILADYINQKDLENVSLLGHSKGGLIINDLLNDQKIKQYVRQNITLATPFRGTIFSKIPFYGLEEYCESQIAKYIPDNSIIPTTNIYPRFDNHVIPHSSLIDKRDGVSNYEVDEIGHTRVLRSKKVIEILQNEQIL